MAEDDIHQPNDKLLKATFSQPENARAFFQNYLPADITVGVDWDSLELEPCSFIDERFASSESDLLFRLKIEGGDAFLYLLFEHQSTEDPRMAFRLLRYVMRIWERFEGEHPPPAKFPPVFPLVLAQGKRPWKTGPRLEELIDLRGRVGEGLRRWQPAFEYRLMELVRMSYAELAGTPEGVLTLKALKAEPMEELMTDVIWEDQLLFRISDSALRRLVRYIWDRESNVSRLRERIVKIQDERLRTKVMTISDYFRQEGRQEGILEGVQKGRQEGIQEGIREGIQEGMSRGQLAAFRTAVLHALKIRHGGYPEEIREALDGIEDPHRLEELLEVAFRSGSVEEFGQELRHFPAEDSGA